LWDRTFETVVEDVLALQNDVAKAVADGIDLHLTSQQRRTNAARVDNPANTEQDFAAFDLYLRGRFFWNMRTEEGLKRSIQYFQEALGRDARYAPAYAGIADAYNLLGIYGFMEREAAGALASQAATRALQLDSSVAEAHASLGLVQMERFEWNDAEASFKRALALKPGDSTTHHWYADYLAYRGRLEDAVTEITTAATLDPLSSAVAADIGAILTLSRRYDEAVAQLEKALRMNSDLAAAHLDLAEAYTHQKRYELALGELQKTSALVANDTVVRGEMGYTLAVAGRRAEALTIANDLVARYRKNDTAAAGAAAFTYVGLLDRDRAFEWLNQAVRHHDSWVAYLKVDPRFDPLRNDRRFGSLLAALGLDQ
jgi:tetratricopeptide (TPR) repeat protein